MGTEEHPKSQINDPNVTNYRNEFSLGVIMQIILSTFVAIKTIALVFKPFTPNTTS